MFLVEKDADYYRYNLNDKFVTCPHRSGKLNRPHISILSRRDIFSHEGETFEGSNAHWQVGIQMLIRIDICSDYSIICIVHTVQLSTRLFELQVE